ncbi:UNVERIFIED_CONTAM: hypothetical protein LK11_19175 [Mumia flava]
MDRLWDAETPMTGRSVLESLRDRDLAYTTVTTILDRLVGKGFAGRDRVGRSYQYHASVGRDELTAQMLRSVLDSAGDDATGALVHFAEQATDDEAEALRRALERIEARHR